MTDLLSCLDCRYRQPSRSCLHRQGLREAIGLFIISQLCRLLCQWEGERGDLSSGEWFYLVFIAMSTVCVAGEKLLYFNVTLYMPVHYHFFPKVYRDSLSLPEIWNNSTMLIKYIDMTAIRCLETQRISRYMYMNNKLEDFSLNIKCTILLLGYVHTWNYDIKI